MNAWAALCIGFGAGLALAAILTRPEPCRRGCCAVKGPGYRPERDTAEPGIPPRHAHNGLCAHPPNEPCRRS